MVDGPDLTHNGCADAFVAALDSSGRGLFYCGYFGWLHGWGRGTASIDLPPWPALIGLRIRAAFITLGPISPLGIKSISNPISFTITR